VKHFKFELSGKKRLHQRPRAAEIRACKPWLLAEIRAVQAKAVVLLGATAAQSLLGGSVRVMKSRGAPIPSSLAPIVFVTIHPSSVLRERDEDARARAFDSLVADLEAVVERLAAIER
jgi:DNA polymerase